MERIDEDALLVCHGGYHVMTLAHLIHENLFIKTIVIHIIVSSGHIERAHGLGLKVLLAIDEEFFDSELSHLLLFALALLECHVTRLEITTVLLVVILDKEFISASNSVEDILVI